MSKEFWDKRYSEKEFSYGTEPNQFFKQQIDKLVPGKILFLGEGEGRNAVYAAKLGWEVDAVDFCVSAKVKAIKLADINNVKINYSISDLTEYQFKENYYDVVVLIFLHLPKDLRDRVHAKTHLALRDNGTLIIEAFNKEQIKNTSGGPRDLELLYDENTLINSFKELKINLIENKIVKLDEGYYHKGKANVIRFVGVKI
jgi:2-polyprenyl-3-methyl-5-hydroxy-6-metoxy-1,4-benzoquinol methylase